MLDRAKRTDLHYAALSDDPVAIQALIAAGADVNAQDGRGLTPLHFAAQEGSLGAAQALRDLGASVDIQDVFGNSPLSNAVYYYPQAKGDLVSLLLDWGADPMLENNYGVSPLSLSRTIANTDVRKYFAHL